MSWIIVGTKPYLGVAGASLRPGLCGQPLCAAPIFGSNTLIQKTPAAHNTISWVRAGAAATKAKECPAGAGLGACTPSGAYLPPPTINGLISRFRHHAEMVDDDLARVIAQALADGREKGLDHIGQTGHAVRAVLVARRDMTASDALRTVNTWLGGE